MNNNEVVPIATVRVEALIKELSITRAFILEPLNHKAILAKADEMFHKQTARTVIKHLFARFNVQVPNKTNLNRQRKIFFIKAALLVDEPKADMIKKFAYEFELNIFSAKSIFYKLVKEYNL